MAAAEYYSGACMECVPKELLTPQTLQRAQTEQLPRRKDDHGIAQGRIMWLPAAEDLPERAVRRAHGKGAVEDGIYNHPVVIVSRPAEDEQAVHFHLITSLQGKKLDQLYPKSNEFHTSRRSWYLPISPSPEHPDATSKKAKKRFPTLALADGASLRWDSYVNIRHVYKIDWTLLKPYSNLNTPRVATFRLERESTVRMVAKGKVLTLYEPSEQNSTPAPLDLDRFGLQQHQPQHTWAGFARLGRREHPFAHNDSSLHFADSHSNAHIADDQADSDVTHSDSSAHCV
ncbi:hypothetical protein N0V91_006472 [Didymella pomorum]|uniref:Uncharacterized protein n=1 Tax=Didymella pomorum TaxID=749634 RepID=A0A9W9D7F9_9PLEO|nr:hypothetical protein N0V91_006472 [Didymella pomorum]